MSDELIKSLNSRIAQLEQDKAGLQVALKKERTERKALKAEYDSLIEQADAGLSEWEQERETLAGELEQLRSAAEAAPDEKDARINELMGQIKSRDVREKFRDVEGQLADGVKLDHLFALQKFDPAGADLEKLDTAELVKGWREAIPGLFRDANGAAKAPTTQGQRPPLQGGEPAGRGARDTASSTLQYRKSDIAVPGWMTKNPELAQAIAKGTAQMVD